VGTRRRASTRYSGRAGRWVERRGAVVLARTWSWAVRAVTWIAIAVEAILVAAWRGFAAATLPGKLVVVAGVVVLALALPRLVPEPVGFATTDEGEALARVIRSEVGGSSPQHRLHVAWATRNLARARGQTIARMACTPCGAQGPGRPVSSRQASTAADRALATYVLDAPALADPTGGASHFINPALQDHLARSGALPGYLGRTYAVVRRRWIERYGWEPYYRLGPDLELWGPRRRGRR
jgi:hypothetical protein